MHNILILGDGFIGSNLYTYFAKNYHVSITNRNNFDILNKKTYNNIPWSKFDTIIYSIGIKDVIECEKKYNLAFDINANYIYDILHLINKTTKFIYISTDYIFDGKTGNYTENDNPNPQTIYGQSKLRGEIISSQHKNYINVRTSGVYGNRCLWFNKLILLLNSNQGLECYTDIYNTPTYAINLAEMIDNLIKYNFIGTINLAGSSIVNRLDLYSMIATIFGKDKKTLYAGNAPLNRFPHNLSLSNHTYSCLFNHKPDNIQTGLIRLKENYVN